MQKIITETDRTTIKKLRLSDAPFIVELVNSPGWLRFIGDRRVTGVADAENFLTTGLLQVYIDRGYGYYKIENEQNVPIGIAGFLKKPFLENEDFGFAFLPEYHGKGYALEACSAVLEYGIKQFNFELLDAVTLPTNQPSKKLLERLGFAYVSDVVDPDTQESVKLFQYSPV